MSYQTRLRDWFATNRVDLTLAKLGLVASIVLFSLQFLASAPLLTVIPLSTGAACLLYLLIGTRRRRQFHAPTLPEAAAGYLPAVVIAGLAGYVLLVWMAGQRTMPAYLLAGGLGSAIVAQVVFLDEQQLKPGLVLFQLFTFAIVLRLSVLFVTPGFIGVDTWTHVPVYVDGIVQSGSLGALSESKYIMAPLYHSFTALSTLVVGDSRIALYLTLGVVIPLSALFVYEAGKRLLPVRWALLGVTLYVFSDEFVRWGLYIIPNSLGLVFFLALVYAITEIFETEAEWWTVLLALAFSLAVVFTHQVSTAIALVVLGIAAIVAAGTEFTTHTAGRNRTAGALGAVFLTTLGVTSLAWLRTPWRGEESFLLSRLELLLETLQGEAGFLNLAGGEATGAGGQQTLLDVLLPFMDLYGLALLLAAAVVGGLVMLRWDGPYDLSLTYVFTGAILFAFVFGLSLFGVRVLVPARWQAFLFVPLAIVAAVGLYYVLQTAPRRIAMAIFLLVALTYPAGMLVAESATQDSPAFPDHQYRVSFNEAEIGAVSTISAIYPPSVGGIQTDQPYWQFFWKRSDYDARELAIGPEGAASSTAIVYRDYQSSGPVEFRRPDDAEGGLYAPAVTESDVCEPARDRVYANDEVRLCLPTDATGEVGS